MATVVAALGAVLLSSIAGRTGVFSGANGTGYASQAKAIPCTAAEGDTITRKADWVRGVDRTGSDGSPKLGL